MKATLIATEADVLHVEYGKVKWPTSISGKEKPKYGSPYLETVEARNHKPSDLLYNDLLLAIESLRGTFDVSQIEAANRIELILQETEQ